jgi:hypothetical protein
MRVVDKINCSLRHVQFLEDFATFCFVCRCPNLMAHTPDQQKLFNQPHQPIV